MGRIRIAEEVDYCSGSTGRRVRKGFKRTSEGIKTLMNKYRNVKTIVDGMKFDSRREANYYIYLKAQRACGGLTFERQVRIPLAAGIKYVVDFVVKHKSGRVEYVDVKGYRTTVYRMKKRLFEHQYGVPITEV